LEFSCAQVFGTHGGFTHLLAVQLCPLGQSPQSIVPPQPSAMTLQSPVAHVFVVQTHMLLLHVTPASAGQLPHSIGLPQSSEMAPHCLPWSAQLFGVHCAGHVPQSIFFPQPSATTPHVAPRAAHVFGTQLCPASAPPKTACHHEKCVVVVATCVASTFSVGIATKLEPAAPLAAE
jgi:hypothetical protein